MAAAGRRLERELAAIGNGGIAGSLILPSMALRLEEGYAVSGTDSDHHGGSLEAAWALGHPEKIIATRYKGDDPASGVAAQRPWCANPANARSSGAGNHSDAAFVCEAQKD